MKIEDFRLERFFDRYEFCVDRQISASDCQTMSVVELLRYGDTTDTWSAGTEQLLNGLGLGYTESKGDPGLREAIAGLYRRVPEGHILVSAPEEGIFLTFQAHLEPGDQVVVMGPAYQSLLSVPRSTGSDVSLWPVELSEEGRWFVDLDRLETLLSERTKMLVVNIPHNPTGLCMSAGEKHDLVELLRSRGIMLFADEMYQGLEYGEEADPTPLCDLYERAISLSGLSKSYGLPGLRIGWLASQDAGLIEPAARLKDYTTICSPGPSEFLATVALTASSQLIQRSLATVLSNLHYVEKMVSRLSCKLHLPLGGGGSVIFPRFIDGTSASTVSRRLIEEKNLMMLPGELFDMPAEFFRVGLGRTDLPDALAVVEELLISET